MTEDPHWAHADTPATAPLRSAPQETATTTLRSDSGDRLAALNAIIESARASKLGKGRDIRSRPAGLAGLLRKQTGATAATAAATVGQLLLVEIGGRRTAIPLDGVTHLEEFPADRIERVGNRDVVQHRGQTLSVIGLADLFGDPQADDGAIVSVVVYSEGRHSVALAVDKIIDIIEDVLEARKEADDHGLVGTSVIEQRVTELLDVRRATAAALAEAQRQATDH